MQSVMIAYKDEMDTRREFLVAKIFVLPRLYSWYCTLLTYLTAIYSLVMFPIPEFPFATASHRLKSSPAAFQTYRFPLSITHCTPPETLSDAFSPCPTLITHTAPKTSANMNTIFTIV